MGMTFTGLWQKIKLNDFEVIGPLIVAGILRFTRIGEYDNPYYTATVSSMLKSTSNFFFGSFDPVGVVMVDKPPFSFWIQTIPASFLGTANWSVVLPQIVIGTIAIWFLYWIIKHTYGRLAGFIAALVLAVIPASVVIDSRNEPDALLSFILLLAAISIIKAVQTRRWYWLIIFGLLIGLGFNTKMMVAFIPLPIFICYYALATRYNISELSKRIILAILTLLIVSLSWISIVALTPENKRPYVGSTPDNSIWTLVLKYNGIDRFTSFIGPRTPRVIPQPLDNPPTNQNPRVNNLMNLYPGPGVLQGIPPKTNQGIFDLFVTPLSNQLGWLLPIGLAMFGLILILYLTPEVYRNPYNIFDIFKNSHVASQTILWGGWLTTGAVIFGLANSTTTHPYYLVGLAVPLAATIGIGSNVLLTRIRENTPLSWAILISLAIFIGWQIYSSRNITPDWALALVIILGLVGMGIACRGLFNNLQLQPLTNGALGLILLSTLLLPVILSLNSSGRLVGPNRPIPSQLAGHAQKGMPLGEDRLNKLLVSQNSNNTNINLITLNARDAAPFILDGISTIAIGGFSGRDPLFTLDSFLSFTKVNGPFYFLLSTQVTNIRTQSANRQRPNNSQEEILSYVQMHWNDVSQVVGLPPRSLYSAE